jgi:adenylate cyclase
LLSSLPVLDTLSNGVLPLRVVRIFRGFRILRILRGLRVLRALRSLPAYENLFVEGSRAVGTTPRHRAMNLGLIGLTGVMLVTIVAVRRSMERDYLHLLDGALAENLTLAHLSELGGSLVRPDAPVVLVRSATVNHRPETVYFDMRPIDRRINQFEFFLTLGMMFAMVMFLYIMTYYQLDVTQTQLRGLLSLALPSQVAEQFVAEPASYTRKSRMPATILFMDLVGFTCTFRDFLHLSHRRQ